MFAAPQQFAHRMPIGLAPSDYSYWRAVELTIRAQWYIVTLRIREDDDWFKRDLLVSWSSDLMDVIQPTDRAIVTAIQLMHPLSGSNKESWSSIDVKNVWVAHHTTERGRTLPVFEASNGDRFCDPMEGVSDPALAGLELVWKKA